MDGAGPAAPPSTERVVWGSMAGLLTHGPCGLLLLLQLPLQAGHLRLEVTCFYGSQERGPQRLCWAWRAASMPCTLQSGGSPGYVEGSRAGGRTSRKVPGGLGPGPPCFPTGWLAHLYTSLGLGVLPGGEGKLRKGSDLPNSLRPHNLSSSWAASGVTAASICLMAFAEPKEVPCGLEMLGN